MIPNLQVDIGGGGGLVHKRAGLVECGSTSRHHKIAKKKRCQRKGMVMKMKMKGHPQMSLQILFLACQHIFKAPNTAAPSSTDVHTLQRIMDAMLPEDVGLNTNVNFFNQQDVVEQSARVLHATIYQCKHFSISLFILPPSAVIPLHNHPGMTVFSKLLFGTMHMKSYDLVEPVELDIQNQPPKFRLAQLKTNKTLSSPCDSTVLYPTSGGNIHEMKALTACAFLDVLGPPYSIGDDRDCSYYRESDASLAAILDGEMGKQDGKNSVCWLEEIEAPKEAEMEMIKYMGPSVYKMAPWN